MLSPDFSLWYVGYLFAVLFLIFQSKAAFMLVGHCRVGRTFITMANNVRSDIFSF